MEPSWASSQLYDLGQVMNPLCLSVYICYRIIFFQSYGIRLLLLVLLLSRFSRVRLCATP